MTRKAIQLYVWEGSFIVWKQTEKKHPFQLWFTVAFTGLNVAAQLRIWLQAKI